MKRAFTNWPFLFCIMLISSAAVAQQEWPKTISAANGNMIKIYQPQPESYTNNVLKSRAAISIIESGKSDPVFGTYWFTAQAPGNGSTVSIQSLEVTDIRFPSDMDDAKISDIKNTLQNEVPKMNVQLSQKELQNALTLNQEQAKLSSTINNAPPKVIYTTKPSMLVLIDGTPKLQMNNDWGVEAVVNSPFTIVKNSDGRFYLYGGKRWFTAPDATGPYSYTTSVPGNLQNVQAAIDKAAADNAASGAKADADNGNDNGDNNAGQSTAVNPDVVPQIIVSTEPAELIQSNGEPNFAPVEGTSLLYVKNSANDIFMNVGSQEYFVLLAGRWYKSNNLKSTWQYIPADQLPADFAKIPEGSPKDNVLASVAGTEAAQDAVADAQVPQTAKVDRKTATSNVTYDGNPDFESISGTDMQYSVNSSNSVLSYHGHYYTVDNGVWFESAGPNGPWTVATNRPDEVDMIPPSYPVYNMKYVYVYDVTPDYVWTGYTPGYLNTYVYGPTIVYGTGYHYRSWYGRYYWPRAYTWGFNMCYNPWYGWNVGWDFDWGWGWGGSWFNIGIWGGRSSYWHGGWWGPSAYRPVCYNPYRSYNYGYYGARARNYYYNNRSVVVNRTYNTNVYNYRRGVVTTVNNRRMIETRSYNRNYSNNNNNFNRGRINNGNGYNNGYNNRMAEGSRPNGGNNSGYNRGGYNRVSPDNGRTNPGYNNNSNRPYMRPTPQSPSNNSNPGYNNRQASPGYQRFNNNNNRVQPSQPQTAPQYSRPQQQQSAPAYSRPQPQQRSYAPPQNYSRPTPAPQQQQRSFERPTPSGGGGGRPSGGDGGGRSSGGGGGRGGDHGRRN